MTTDLLYIGIFIIGFVTGLLYAAWSTYRSQQKAQQKAEMEKLLATLARAEAIIKQNEGANHEAQK